MHINDKPNINSNQYSSAKFVDNNFYTLQTLQTKLIELFQSHNASKTLQKIVFCIINFFPDHLKKTAVGNIVASLESNIDIFIQIQYKEQVRVKCLNQLKKYADNQVEVNKQFIIKICKKIYQYRVFVLEYIEELLKFCHIISHPNQNVYQKTVRRCNKIFITLHEEISKINICSNLFIFSQDIDPLVMNITSKSSQTKEILQNQSHLYKQFEKRFVTVQDQIQQNIKKQNKVKPQMINQQISNYLLSRKLKQRKLKSKNSITNSQSQPQSSQNFQSEIRKNRFSQKKHEKMQDIKLKIIQNSRKNAFKHRLSLSMDKKKTQDDVDLHQIATISTDDYKNTHKKVIQSRQGYIKISKRLNFKAVNLQPLQHRLSVGKLSMPEQKQNTTKQQGKIYLFHSKKNNHRKLRYMQSRTDQSSEGEIKQKSRRGSEQNNGLKFQRNGNSSPNSPNRLGYILSKRKLIKFESQQDQGSQLSDDSSISSPISYDLIQKLRNKSKSKNKEKQIRIFNQNPLIENRKIKLAQVDQQDISRGVTPQEGELQNQILKLNQTNNKKQDKVDDKKIRKKSEVIKCEIQQQQTAKQVNHENIFLPQDQQTSQIIEQNHNNNNISTQNNDQLIINKTNQIINNSNQNNSFSSINKINIQSVNKFDLDQRKKKIILKAAKVNSSKLNQYFDQYNIINYNKLVNQISFHHHYICQFYLNQTIFNIIVFAPSINFTTINIKLIHQVNHNQQQEIFQSLHIKQKFRKVVIKNFIQIIQKSASSTFTSIKLPTQLHQQKQWLIQSGFKQIDKHLVYQLNKKHNQQKSKQFLSIYGSIFVIQQKVNQCFLYSDEISPFKNGKYDVHQNIFLNNQFNFMTLQNLSGFNSLNDLNQVLQQKQLDTYEAASQVQTLLFSQPQSNKNDKLKMFSFEKLLIQNFIISNGWIKTTSNLIFQDKNQKISQIKLPQNYEIYFGKGFEHIGTMKNKITHHKTRRSSSKNQQNSSKLITTKIRMFSKQLYGLIKYENKMAFYGNWEMNFHFKHQFLGKVIYSIETQPNQNHIIFGNTTFFVTIYQGDQFIIGWEVEENDYLY